MKKYLVLALILCTACSFALAQNAHPQPKKERKKNLVIKEWNLKAGSKTPFLDNVISYDDKGRKIEEVEYASYGQKMRIVYEYKGNSAKCTREVVYNDKNKVVRIKKYEYNNDGTKKKQYNYNPNGKLESTKDFEYTYK